MAPKKKKPVEDVVVNEDFDEEEEDEGDGFGEGDTVYSMPCQKCNTQITSKTPMRTAGDCYCPQCKKFIDEQALKVIAKREQEEQENKTKENKVVPIKKRTRQTVAESRIQPVHAKPVTKIRELVKNPFYSAFADCMIEEENGVYYTETGIVVDGDNLNNVLAEQEVNATMYAELLSGYGQNAKDVAESFALYILDGNKSVEQNKFLFHKCSSNTDENPIGPCQLFNIKESDLGNLDIECYECGALIVKDIPFDALDIAEGDFEVK
jgi:hypothetical protein